MLKELYDFLIIPVINFVKANYVVIIVIIVLVAIFYIVFYLTTNSLRKLKTEIFSNYPFDIFFPHSGEWSIGYFLIVILFLGLLMYFMIKGRLYLGPA